MVGQQIVSRNTLKFKIPHVADKLFACTFYRIKCLLTDLGNARVRHCHKAKEETKQFQLLLKVKAKLEANAYNLSLFGYSVRLFSNSSFFILHCIVYSTTINSVVNSLKFGLIAG